MNSNAKQWRRMVVAVVLLGLTIPVTAFAGGKGNPNPGILPINSSSHGMTYAEWSVKWWQWLYSLPVSMNPAFDTTGALAGNGQSGQVFFLTGVFNVSGTAERTITVPTGKALFFPILNVSWDNNCVVPPLTVDELYAAAASWVATTSELQASLDGVPLNSLFDYRVVSPVFSYVLPPTDNIAQFFGCDVSGTTYPVVSDGFWLMLAPLSAGQHELNFGGTFGEPINFTLDITYHITVKPGKS
jgi:hypothetical protein